jgi:hypothetical protein
MHGAEIGDQRRVPVAAPKTKSWRSPPGGVESFAQHFMTKARRSWRRARHRNAARTDADPSAPAPALDAQRREAERRLVREIAAGMGSKVMTASGALRAARAPLPPAPPDGPDDAAEIADGTAGAAGLRGTSE